MKLVPTLFQKPAWSYLNKIYCGFFGILLVASCGVYFRSKDPSTNGPRDAPKREG
jgi:hypothetical protein